MTDLPCQNQCGCACKKRRDFLHLTAGAMGAVGVAGALIPFVSSLNPSADVKALATVEVDLNKIPLGKTQTVMWRGKPVFVKHRTTEEVKTLRSVALQALMDPVQGKDEERVKKPEWLLVLASCTHLGCIPNEKSGITASGDGWLCPCHGSIYDASGRVIKGPAPRNLEIPPYTFVNDTLIRIG
ncbi:MAG TPA: ubiquinol-cytochrome c reductase iron-sulfur subunit [Alphaproteobacteria bacterium]|nr:ubiquinol-cytochrome c reductase iron-sulfur subunit [Alphaproteobacteria bacterium]